MQIAAMQLGHPLIDQQHNQIFDWFDKLEQELNQGQGYQLVESTLKSLQLYIQTHFSAEEQLMEQLGYPEVEPHRQQHRQFCQQVQQLCDDWDAMQPVLAIELSQMLRSWLINHINSTDAELLPYLDSA